MYIINAQYFVGQLNIPNLITSGGYPDEQGNEFDIDSLIQDNVHSLLNAILGRKTYIDFIGNLDEQGALKPDAEQKYEDLLNGCDYIRNGKTKYFKGLIYKRGTIHKSLLAEYVYIKYIEQTITQLTGVGDIVVEAKNAINVNSSGRWATAWNNFITSVVGKHNNRDKFYLHNGVLIADYYRGRNLGEPSLFEYLRDRKELYPECAFELPNNEELTFKNRLGL